MLAEIFLARLQTLVRSRGPDGSSTLPYDPRFVPIRAPRD
jgi:hypothetical protein